MPYSWENRLKISIFGRSHEKEIGAELSGIPAGEPKTPNFQDFKP